MRPARPEVPQGKLGLLRMVEENDGFPRARRRSYEVVDNGILFARRRESATLFSMRGVPLR